MDGDLAALAVLEYPFLTCREVRVQIEGISGLLGRVDTTVRRLAIGYSLYIRQVATIQAPEVAPRCGRACPRPPVGCCNADHFVLLSAADILVGQPSQRAMHLAHVLTGLQRLEHEHSLLTGQIMAPGHCARLSETGCTLRLFKSPRCAHYLCTQAAGDLSTARGPGAEPFLAAMRLGATRTIALVSDFTTPETLSCAVSLFPAAR